MSNKILGLAFALLFTAVAIADEAPAKKKRNGPAAKNSPAVSMLKRLEAADLTVEQKSKIEEMAKKAMTDTRAARKEAGVTPELTKKRAAAMKELKESGTKPNEMLAAVNKKLELTEAQAAFFKKQNEGRTALFNSAVGLLTEEQKAKLPKRIQRPAGRGGNAKGKGQGKRKKKSDE